MASKKGAAAEQQALATTSDESGTELAEVTHDELSALGDFDFGATDGLEELEPEDVKLAVKVFNMRGVDKETGDPIQKNTFFDTIEESTKKRLDLILLTIHKTNEWREFDSEKDESVIHCRSFDRVTGIMADGTERPCKGCPDAKWTTDDKGKRTRRCGPVYNTFAIDRDTRQPCVIRFKRTSLKPLQSYLNKHHIGRRVVKGQRMNYPLFSFRCEASLQMSENGMYAIPVLEKREVLSRDELQTALESTKYVREALIPELEKVVEKDTDDAGVSASDDASFSPDDFSDEAPEQAAPAEAGNRF